MSRVSHCHTDLPQLLRADLPVPVSVEESEGFLQTLHLSWLDVSVWACQVRHGPHITL